MSFLSKITAWNKSDPLNRVVSGWALSPFDPKKPPPAPQSPNPNDAANAAQQTTAATRWLSLLGFEFEGDMRGYGENGETHERWARIR